jgi:hypothetical protein
MILYKAIRILLLDEAMKIFFAGLRRNINPKTKENFWGTFLEQIGDLPVYRCLEDGVVKWVAFDEDSFPLGFFDTENQAIEAWFTQFPEVPIDEEL